ncbi:MAG: UbiA family prenyltransferase [Xanthobacteraceae bacterium]|nr:UbiA family prenyltransferase [Xanthobacteraceae bacterium]
MRPMSSGSVVLDREPKGESRTNDNTAIDSPRPARTIAALPLVVDLDGTLVKTDLLHENCLQSLSATPTHHWSSVKSLRAGKACFKQHLANSHAIDYSLLPYDDHVLDLIEMARREGRPVYLATAGDTKHAQGIADHLGLFDGIFASNGTINLSSQAKAGNLVKVFGHRGFDYIGNSSADLAVWAEARKAYSVRAGARVRRALDSVACDVEHLTVPHASIKSWIRAIRVHQYAKNMLIFVPLVTAHAFFIQSFYSALLAFCAFCACASAVYILNDLVDLEADRRHPSKRLRPFACGAIPIAHAVVAVPVLLALSIICAILVSPMFTGVLAIYFSMTIAYSLFLKQRMLVDVVTLAGLYTIRVIAGAVAIEVAISEWLLAFSMFIFVSLALIKRYIELMMQISQKIPNSSARDYTSDDVNIIAALAAASGFNAVTIFALYISSPKVQQLYSQPMALWLICPILMYWIARILLLAHRRAVDDDPIVFALRDRVSRLAVASMVLIVLAAS